MNQNLTDKACTQLILNPKGTARTDSNRNIPLEPEWSPRQPLPLFQREGSEDEQGSPENPSSKRLHKGNVDSHTKLLAGDAL